ncbi:MAG TPA: 6-phosphogluconolactonase [Aggregatilineales bacterium]|nr:6-phosphogluconolactonase [Aggregatilineales bacterium]
MTESGKAIQTYPDAQALARAAAEQFVTLGSAAIAGAGRFSVALSGGSTPQAMFNLLATEPFVKRIEWARVHLFWGDERCVPPDHPDSNYRMTREALLDKIAIPAANVHRMRGEVDPVQAVAEYAEGLRAFFGMANFPHFDLVLLGMGDDGHTASLFPGTAAIHESNAWVIAPYVAKVSMWRMTLTPPVLNAARQIRFLVAGAGKADRLADVLNGPYQPDTLPAQIVKPTGGELVWMVDAAAASKIQ